jgi:ABC-type polysaccharide/polyol phosphate export permease
MKQETIEVIHSTRLTENLLWKGLADIYESLFAWRLWLLIGYRDVKSQFSRSFLGGWWLTAHSFAWISALVFIFSNVFDLEADLNAYIAYVAFGLIFFNYINAVVTGASEVFIRSRIIIHSHPGPLLVHPLRLVASATMQLGFQALAVVPYLIFFPIELSVESLLFIPGFLLTLVMAVFVALTLSIAGARFGDFRFAILAIMRLMFFVTPIFWTLDQWGGLPLQIVTLNPITTFIAMLREPLLGNVPPPFVYYKAIAWTLGFAALGTAWFVRVRSTIAMWV